MPRTWRIKGNEKGRLQQESTTAGVSSDQLQNETEEWWSSPLLQDKIWQELLQKQIKRRRAVVNLLFQEATFVSCQFFLTRDIDRIRTTTRLLRTYLDTRKNNLTEHENMPVGYPATDHFMNRYHAIQAGATLDLASRSSTKQNNWAYVSCMISS